MFKTMESADFMMHMPLETKEDLIPPKKDAIVQVYTQRFTQTQADTLNAQELFCDGVICPGFMYDCQLSGKLTKIDSAGVDLASADEATLCDTAKMLVRQVNVAINGNEKINFNGARQFWSILEQLEADNEDESMSYYNKCDEVRTTTADLTAAQVNDGSAIATQIHEKDLCKREIYSERVQRL